KDKYFKTIEEYAKKIFEQEVKIEDILDYCEDGRIEFEIIKNTQITQKETDILLDTCKETCKKLKDKITNKENFISDLLKNNDDKIYKPFMYKGIIYNLLYDKDVISELGN
ncbi:18284_t:CDS:2, partial [Gigaspora margarita]